MTPPSGAAELRVDPACAVLLIVDVQVKLAAAMDPQAFAVCERNILTLIELARRLKLPLVVSEQYPRGLGPTVPGIAAELEGAVTAGSRLSRLEKTAFACTEDPAFAPLLEDLGPQRRQWLVTGMESHVCVWQTVRGLLALGRAVQVIEDAVLSRQPANHRVGRRLCERAGAVITSTETVAFDALVRAGSEDFKAISRRVK
jgi:nicotinamidase-related amidase